MFWRFPLLIPLEVGHVSNAQPGAGPARFGPREGNTVAMSQSVTRNSRRSRILILTAIALCCIALPSRALDGISWGALSNTPAGQTFGGISMDALPDGRCVLLDGHGIWLQTVPNGDGWTYVADGYYGDPGFVAVHPDGHTLAVSAGSGAFAYPMNIWLVDLRNPVDAPANTNVLEVPYTFSGVWISRSMLLVGGNPGGWGADDELGVIDWSGTPAYRTVIANKGGYSTDVKRDLTGTHIYATFNDLSLNEVRRFAVADLVAAYRDNAPIDWSDGEVVVTDTTGGMGGGVAGVTDMGYLLMSGYGPIEVVDPANGTIVAELDPDNAGAVAFYSNVMYNRGARQIWAMQYFGPLHHSNPQPGLPAAGNVALTILVAACIALGAWRLRPARASR